MIDTTGLSDAQILALTGAAEARAEFVVGKGWTPAPLDRMIAVMCIPLNRVAASPKRFGATVSAACLASAQFSCWNEGSGANHDWLAGQVAKMKAGEAVADVVTDCLMASTALLEKILPDVVHGATHYYAPMSMVPTGRVPPWAVGKTPVATSGGHLFFVGV